MKLKYKFVCKDTDIPECNFVTYGKTKKKIVKRVQDYLRDIGYSEADNPQTAERIKSAIRKSQYV